MNSKIEPKWQGEASFQQTYSFKQSPRRCLGLQSHLNQAVDSKYKSLLFYGTEIF